MVINTIPRTQVTKHKSTKLLPFKKALDELKSRPDDVIFVTGIQHRESLYVAARPEKIAVRRGEVDGEVGFYVEFQ
jgi:NAD(P)H-flavin reductase